MRRQGDRPRPYLVATHSISAGFHKYSVFFFAIQRFIISYTAAVYYHAAVNGTRRREDYVLVHIMRQSFRSGAIVQTLLLLRPFIYIQAHLFHVPSIYSFFIVVLPLIRL